MISDLFDELKSLLSSHSSKSLNSQLDYVVSMEMFDIRMMTLHDLMKTGELVDSDDPKFMTAGDALYIDE